MLLCTEAAAVTSLLCQFDGETLLFRVTQYQLEGPLTQAIETLRQTRCDLLQSGSVVALFGGSVLYGRLLTRKVEQGSLSRPSLCTG